MDIHFAYVAMVVAGMAAFALTLFTVSRIAR